MGISRSLTGGATLPVALNQLLHPADQLLPHVIKQQVEDGLTAARVRRDGRKTARPASRLGTVLFTLVVSDGNRKVSQRNLIKALRGMIFLEVEASYKSLLSKAKYSSIRPSTSSIVGFS